MSPLETLANLAIWGARNTAYNLTFIGDDKLDWKPAPTAKSALEIVNHVALAVRSMEPVLRGGEHSPAQFTHAVNLQEAQTLLVTSAEEYAAALREVQREDFTRQVTVWGRLTLPLLRAATMPVVDLVHHHGQIAYLQTLLGDEEMHFDPAMAG